MSEVDEAVTEAVKKLMGIKKFKVYASETVYFAVEVEAKSREEAWELARSGEVDFPSDAIYDGNNFQLDEVEEVTE